MPWPFLIALAGIAWLAYMGYLDHKSRMAKLGGAAPELGRTLDDVRRRLEQAEGEGARLRQRVENLEAIVTSERYELEREAQQALAPGAPAPRLALPDADAADGTDGTDAEEVARLARRVRGT